MPKPQAMNSTESASQSPYIHEYMAAVDRTEALGLKAPVRLIVRKNCVDMMRVRPVVLAYFDRHKPQELVGQTLAIHFALIPMLADNTGVPFNLTVGWMTRDGKAFFQHDEETIRRFMREKLSAWQREGMPFHLWLTSPAFEIVDVTFALNCGWASNRRQCDELIVYKSADSPATNLIYHPTIVGQDFFLKTGAVL